MNKKLLISTILFASIVTAGAQSYVDPYTNANTQIPQGSSSLGSQSSSNQISYSNTSDPQQPTTSIRAIYNPYKENLNFVDSLALRVYCKLAPIFMSAYSKCYVPAGGVVMKESSIDLSPVNMKLASQQQQIDDLLKRPTTTSTVMSGSSIIKYISGAGQTIVKYISTPGPKGDTGPVGPQGPAGASGTGGAFTTIPNTVYQYVPVSSGGGTGATGATGAQGPAGPQGPAGSSTVATTTYDLTATGTITTNNLLFTNGTGTNLTIIGTATFATATFNNVNNDLMFNGGVLQTGAPLVKNTSTNMSGFNREWFGLGNFGILGATSTTFNTEKLSVYGNIKVVNSDRGTNVGLNNTATSTGASAIGQSNIANDTNSSAFGHGNTASNNAASAFGEGNRATGTYSFAAGYKNTASETYTTAVGLENVASGDQSVAFGATNTAADLRSMAFGIYNTVLGQYSLANGYQNQIDAGASDSTAFGLYNTISGSKSMVLGYMSSSTVDSSLTIGNNLNNNLTGSTMIGTSDLTKLFIGSDGFVSIGDGVNPVNTVVTPVSGTLIAPSPAAIPERLRVSGKVTAQAFEVNGAADLAEMFPSSDTNIEAGHIVMFTDEDFDWSTNGKKGDSYKMSGVALANSPTKVAGVVATNPGFLLGKDTKNGVPVAFQGRVPVKVTSENGEIQKGDRITLSATVPGMGMKQTSTGQTIGIALSNQDNSGKVLMVVSNNYHYFSDASSQSVVAPQLEVTSQISHPSQLCIEDLCINKSILQKIIDMVNLFSPSKTLTPPSDTSTQQTADISSSKDTNTSGQSSIEKSNVTTEISNITNTSASGEIAVPEQPKDLGTN